MTTIKRFLRFIGLYFSKTYIADKLATKKTLSVFFAIMGGIWLLIRLVSLNAEAGQFMETHITTFHIFLAGIVCTLIDRRPETKITKKIHGLDVIINIRIGNVIDMKDACVVPTNTTFDTKLETIIANESVQGQFTKTFYDVSSHLDIDITNALGNTEYEDISREKDRLGNKRRYPAGTVAKVTPRGRTFYLLAMADINRTGNAVSDFSMIRNSLSCLWRFLGEAGNYERELLIPLIGTGRGRVSQSREEIICEIVDSFIAASTDSRLCDSLSIVIYSSDFYRFNLKMEGLREYLNAQCRYSWVRRSLGDGLERNR